MFMDLSSELVHSLLPIYMATVLGSSMLTIGVVEGIAEAIASISKMFSGALSDYFGKRKPLMLLGYGLSAATKPIFPMASSIILVAAARFADRVGKKFVSQQAASQAKNRCLGELSGKIGETHKVEAQEVFRFLGRRDLVADLALNLPFALLYCLAAGIMIGKLQRSYPIEEGWEPVIIIAGLTSVAFGAGAVILGEHWSILAEMGRVGNGHLSNRVDRLPWALHRGWFFAGAVLLFWLAGVVRYRQTS